MAPKVIQPELTPYWGHYSVKRVEKKFVKEPDGIEKYVLAGWAPVSPFLTKGDRVTTFGSCFGHVIVEYLKHPDFKYKVTPMSPEEKQLPLVENGFRFVSPVLIYQQLKWAWEDGGMLWDNWVNPESSGIDVEILRKRTRDVFNDTSVFILSLGLSEIWRHKQNGLVKFGPTHELDTERSDIEFHISTCQETREAIQGILNIIRRYKPQTTVVFTVSPIPLQSTFRSVSSITANCVSKSIIRATLDEVLRANQDDDRLYYWPAYEIIQEMPVEDKWQPDGWHPYRHHSDEIVALFRKYFYKE
jgi:hypothetical protein